MTKRTGVRLRALLARWLDVTTMERFIDPVLADLQSEYEHAVDTGRRWQSRRIWLTGHVALCKMLLWHGLTRGAPSLLGVADERRSLNRTLAAWLLFTVAATPIFVVPLLMNVPVDGHRLTRLTMLLVPQAVEFVLPFSLMGAILLGLADIHSAQRSRMLVLLVAAISSLGVFLIRDLVVPASNQAYRVTVFGAVTEPEGVQFEAPLARGLNELTLAEISQIMRPPSNPRDFVSEDARRFAYAPPASDRNISRVYHGRLAFAWAPLALALFALTVTRRTQSRLWLGSTGVAASVIYLFLLQWPVRSGGEFVPPAVAAWVPNTVFLLFTIGIARSSFRRA